MKYHDYLREYCGLRGPAWRAEEAAKLAHGEEHSSVDGVDTHVMELHRFQRACSQGKAERARARAGCPAIAAACEFSQDDGAVACAKILTLGACQRSEIAERLGISEDTLEMWECLFFDVRTGLASTAWVQAQVIQPEIDRGDLELASKIKAAWAGGPTVAWGILDLGSRIPITVGEKLFDRSLTLHLNLDQAAAVPLQTNRAKIAFLKSCADLQLRERRLELEKQRFAQRCAEARDKHEEAKIRLEMTEQRAAAREAARVRRRLKLQLQKAKENESLMLLAARRQAQLQAEERAAVARAAACPLAALTWKSPVASDAPAAKGDAQDVQSEIESLREETTSADDALWGGDALENLPGENLDGVTVPA
jgi:hypothetical protein